jgi:hypothetical protein
MQSWTERLLFPHHQYHKAVRQNRRPGMWLGLGGGWRLAKFRCDQKYHVGFWVEGHGSRTLFRGHILHNAELAWRIFVRNR